MYNPLKTLAAAIAVASLPMSISAAPYSQLIIFGDSLSDSGQFPDLGNPLSASGNRFTNRVGPTYSAQESFGQVSVQLLASQLGLQALPSAPARVGGSPTPGGTNYAVGGYTTDQIRDSITTAMSVPAPAPVIPGARLGYLAEFGRADRNALFYINGGGNDVIQSLLGAPFDPTLSAAALVSGVAALQQAGARYIVVSDLPDVGPTPFATAWGQRTLGSNNSANFNRELDQQLAALGGNILRLNFNGLLTEVYADLESFGFANIDQTRTCFTSCGTSVGPELRDTVFGLGGTSPNPDRLIFNDDVHATNAVQRLTADYMYAILAAPAEITLLPEMGLASLTSHQQHLQSQWQTQRGNWQETGKWNGFVAGGAMRNDFKNAQVTPSADGKGTQLTLGSSYRLDDNWRLGLAVGLQRQKLDTASKSTYELDSYLLTGFAQYQRERAWADASLSYGHLDYSDLKRQFALGITQRAEKGDTDGSLLAFSARVGYDLANPGTGWQVSPFISADIAKVDVDGYREAGTRSTALFYGDQQRDSQRLGLGVQMKRQLNQQTAWHAELATEREMKDDPTHVRTGLVSRPGNSASLPGYMPEKSNLTGAVGITHDLGNELQVGASYHFRGTDDRQHGLNLSLGWNW
ncbi:autotransporter domain-containing SGNH/GDSL hydrolase family protein [Halopseudomonas yangmingensis]|uniref:Outer membrane lipase/esterase n=1 Tax=Halopseudomonas yangmingensis TaxID=1720063 RepID=A0A1I4RXB6_9GAMM|nr:autotransporter domain-containing SGNH/GDSL hydrolase family protein [Halopseudomonas yangmingensis]SFM56912.1 outer membrane lipase/esterase [Halopseudomonas yangmingensis]